MYEDYHIRRGRLDCLFLLKGHFRSLQVENKQREAPRFSISIHRVVRCLQFTERLTIMKKWLFLCLAAVAISVQATATHLVLSRSSGTQLLQDIATIGKVVFVGDDLQLLAHDGTVLAQEPIAEVQQITFADGPEPTSVEGATASGIILYPNPTQDRLVVQGAEGQTLRVFDLQGRLLKQTESTEVQVEDLANGTYLLQIGTQVVRFIKQ